MSFPLRLTGSTGAGASNFPGPSIAQHIHDSGGPLAQRYRTLAAIERTEAYKHGQRSGIVAGIQAKIHESRARAFDEAEEIAAGFYHSPTSTGD